jgi:hypothetical protein
MADISGFWTTGGTSGDQQVSYTQAQWSTASKILSACIGFEGVASNYLNELACTYTGANTVAMNTGGALVDGKWYLNDASQNITIPSASAGTTRVDRIVLRASWAGYTVAPTVITGTVSAPAITQTSGTTYDILMYRASVTDAGVVTLTDERTFANVTAAKTANRTRTVLVQAVSDNTTTAVIDDYGAPLVDAAAHTAHGMFRVPSDFVSGMTVDVIVYVGTGSGNVRLSSAVNYGALNEAYNTHSASSAESTYTVTTSQVKSYIQHSLTSAAAGDYLFMYVYRDGEDALDNAATTIYVVGFLVSYTADS